MVSDSDALNLKSGSKTFKAQIPISNRYGEITFQKPWRSGRFMMEIDFMFGKKKKGFYKIIMRPFCKDFSAFIRLPIWREKELPREICSQL